MRTRIMPTLLLIGLACWLAIVIIVLAALRAAARADEVAERHARAMFEGGEATAPVPLPGNLPGAARRRHLAVAEAATIALVAVLASITSDGSDWRPLALSGLLAVLAVASDLHAFRAKDFRVSASFPALVVAMALLGPAPAVVIGAACALTDALFSRPRADLLVNNLLAYTAPSLAGALLIDAGGRDASDLAGAPIIVGVYLFTAALQFAIVAGHSALLARGGLRRMIRSEFLPVQPWEASAAIVTAAVVYVYGVRGAAGLAVLAVVGLMFQWLLRSLVEGLRRGTVIERQSEAFGAQTAGMIALVLHLLAVRDPAFCRHAAAVAHHARLLAAAAGLSEREQDVVHAAGLLHDIGRQTFPDTLLRAEEPVDEAGRQAIRRHPQEGAQLLREVPGLWEIADAVETHHERIDGSGYPHGLAGGRIPRAARMLAIAEVYDVLTAEDSYRGRRDHAWAAHELRRVAGSQLDPRLVELFLTAAVPQAARRPSLEEELPALRSTFGAFGPRPAPG